MDDPRIDFPQSLQMRALGALDIAGLDTAAAATVLAQPKRLALLLYLAVAPHPYFRRRDSIIALFWPELDEPHARGALRQALKFLRQALGPDVIVTRGLDEVGVSRRAMRVDVLEFERAAATNEPAVALSHYRGDLLDGVHVSSVAEELESWIAGERRRLRTMARDCARSLAETARRDHTMRDAVLWSQRAYVLSDHEERDLARLLRALAESGDRVGALRLYDEYALELTQSVGGVPATETRAMIQQIREGSLGRTAPPPETPPEPVPVRTHDDRTASIPPRGTASSWETITRRPVDAFLSVLLVASLWFVFQLGVSHEPSTRASATVATQSRVPVVTTNATARAAYARGQNLLGKRDTSSIRAARDAFLLAIDADPSFADAWVGLSTAYAWFAYDAMLPSADAFARSDEAARKALALNPESGMARVLLASSVAFQEWRWQEGERAIRDGIATDSLQADAYDLLGNLLRVEERFDEALVAERTAARLDPLGRHYEFQTGHILMCAGRYAEAREMGRAALSLGSNYQRGHQLAAEASEHLGHYREALEELAVANAEPLGASRYHALSDAAARHVLDSLSRRDANEEVKRVEHLIPGQFVPPTVRAERYAATGQWSDVFHWLDEAVRVHDVFLKNVSCETAFDPIHDDPRFRAVLRKVGLPATVRRVAR